MTPRSAFTYFACLALATLSLSWAGSAFSRLVSSPSVWSYVEVIAAPAMLAASIFLVCLFRYAYEKGRGQIRREAPLFERFLRRLSPDDTTSRPRHG